MVLFLLYFLHVVFAVALILVVLLQTGKGSDLASAFGGGGSAAIFGGGGTTTFMHKLTTGAAVLFMLSCILLTIMTKGTIVESITDGMLPAGESSVPITVDDSTEEKGLMPDEEGLIPDSDSGSGEEAVPGYEGASGALAAEEAPLKPETGAAEPPAEPERDAGG